MKCCRNMFSTK